MFNNRHVRKILPNLIGVFPSLFSTSTTLVRNPEPSTPASSVSGGAIRSPRNTTTRLFSLETTIVNEQLSLPAPTYACLQVNDGAIQIAEACNGALTTNTKAVHLRNATSVLLKCLQDTARQQDRQYIAASLQQGSHQLETASKLWLQQDIVPYIMSSADVANSQQQAPEKQVRDVESHFDEHTIVKVDINAQHEVEVAELVTLEDYRKVTSPADFALLKSLVRAFQGKRLVFFSATPQGGGVALMRHALIRLLRLLDVDAHWYVLIPKREVFNITKAKFHNVLQAVALPETVLTTEDMDIYNLWMAENAQAFEDVFTQSDVIVIDDPQPSGLIPYIKEANPDAKIIYRSHIQIVGSLASQPGTTQYTTWQFLWQNIRLADIFVSHPMKMFIPDDVPAEKIYLHACHNRSAGRTEQAAHRTANVHLHVDIQ